MEYQILIMIVETLFFLALTGALVALAWAQIKTGKHKYMQTIHEAIGQVKAAARDSVMELQQTVVDGLKAASADGKLTEAEIKDLGKQLLAKTMAKLAPVVITLLTAAKVDLTATITSAAEAKIAEMHAAEGLLICGEETE